MTWDEEECISTNYRPFVTLVYKARVSEYILYLFIYAAGVEPTLLLRQPFIGLLYQLIMIDGDDYGAVSGMNGKGILPHCRYGHHRSYIN
jgi:hypothetical protein